MTKKILVALSLAALAGAPTFAATLEEVDTNQDGMIDAAEAAAAGFDLSTADTNQDGVLSREELEAATGEQKE